MGKSNFFTRNSLRVLATIDAQWWNPKHSGNSNPGIITTHPMYIQIDIQVYKNYGQIHQSWQQTLSVWICSGICGRKLMCNVLIIKNLLQSSERLSHEKINATYFFIFYSSAI